MGLFDFFRPRSAASKKDDAPLEELFDEGFLRLLSTFALVSRRAHGGQRRGDRRSKKRGGGVEFADYRPYVPGDDIRSLDLGAYERFDKLLVRLYEEEEDRSLYVVVDCSASMGHGSGRKLRLAARLAAALAYVGLAGHDRVSVLAVNEDVALRLPPTRGKGRIFRVLEFLSRLEARGTTDLGRALGRFAASEKRRGSVILLTDLYDPHGLTAGLDVLRFNRFEPFVLHLREASDWDPGRLGDVNVVDVETAEARDVTVTAELLRSLEAASEETRQAVAQHCAARGVLYFPIAVEQELEHIVLGVLGRGGLFE